MLRGPCCWGVIIGSQVPINYGRELYQRCSVLDRPALVALSRHEAGTLFPVISITQAVNTPPNANPPENEIQSIPRVNALKPMPTSKTGNTQRQGPGVRSTGASLGSWSICMQRRIGKDQISCNNHLRRTTHTRALRER